ncbi:DNRLRE domain-containing protein [Halogeometricum pallidum]|uniref:DNRLRE domain-containing protein n=1 Tax=Halogeometricum pallidum TaxID=411361 RepID=UPI0009FE159E|nr:DNRLRE domain-containing protein [Halogeometricum pallidum]
MPQHSRRDADGSRPKTNDSHPVSRRNYLRAVGAVGVAGLGVRAGSAGAAAASPWTVVAIPDTQKYAESSSLISRAHAQTDWIRANRSAENIAFVSHEGDLVEHGSSTTEWQRMDAVMDKLDGVVPYGTTIGNHDYATTSNRSSSLANYVKYFGKSRYSGKSWYLGAGPGERAHYQRFSAGGYTFLHVNLEWGVPGTVSDSGTVMGWADDVLSKYATTPTIVTTHSYLWDKSGVEGHAGQRSGANSGLDIYRNLVRRHPQVFMVLGGHFHYTDGQWKQTSTNTAGTAIYEMLADYQHYANGGDGWMRLIKFIPDGGSGSLDRVSVRTYSPSRKQYKTDGRSQFSFDFSFASRFGQPSSGSGSTGGTTGTATFQQGSGGYAGTQDTYLRESSPTTGYGSATTLVVDTDEPSKSGRKTHGLLRFDGIVGTGTGQIPTGATVTSATLSLRTVDPGNGASLHRMRTTWSESSTWSSLGSGVQTNDAEAAATADAKTGATSTGTTTVDVTKSVQAWVGGAANLGWAFIPLSGGNGWDFYSSEGSTPPKLTVTYQRP